MISRNFTVLLVSAALAAVECGPPTDTPNENLYGPRPCPPAGESVTRSRTIDTHRMVKEKVDDAARAARRYGCRVRVVIRDGRTIESARPAPRVIDVEVRDGRITRIVAVGEREG